MADNVERVLILSSRLKVVIEIIGFKKKQEKLLNNLLLLVLPQGAPTGRSRNIPLP